MFTLASNDGEVTLVEGCRRVRIAFPTEAIARVTCTDSPSFRADASLIVTATSRFTDYSFEETTKSYVIGTSVLQLVVDKASAAIQYFDSRGKLLVREPERGGKWLTPRAVTRNVFARNTAVAFEENAGDSVDGARADAASCETVFDRMAYEARLDLVFSDDEALFGLGSHEEGYGNLRGRSRELYQQNMKAVVPVLVSTRGYALLLDCGSLMTFHDDALGSYLWADCVDELDYYFLQGEDLEGIHQAYYSLTGGVPLPPRWVFGYVQSKERYVTGEELLEVVREYRRREIPLDGIVVDWKSWPDGAGWGQKTLDPVRFPAPKALTAALHAEGVHLMVSIWPIMTGGCADQRELLARDHMLGNQSTYDAFSPEARAVYWEQARRGLLAQGVDAWWCDCTEPFEADWSGAVKPEPHARLALNAGQSKRFLDAGQINTYSLVHSQGIYEGQRGATAEKRVVNLTRSSYAGQHRYGTITWNGDVSATWETLRRSIAEGVNFCATGEPWWTVDVGGFFVAHNAKLWFWRGDYNANTRGLTPAHAAGPDPADTGCTDLGFHELYVRWLQYAAFLPMFRSHGTDAAREIWRFGEPGNRFYDTIAAYIRLRMRLIPFLYSLAAQVTFHGRPMIRAVALQFPEDAGTHDLLDQFLLGPALLVCPVTQAMYYGRESCPLEGIAETRAVYLPAGHAWFDFWTNEVHAGGGTITAEAPLERIPLYARSGSILPLGEVTQFAGELPRACYTLNVYMGADATFTLYEDAGDGYAYEGGAYAEIHLRWTESDGTLTFAAREGAFPELVGERMFHVRFLSREGETNTSVLYDGSALSITGRP